jgi:hypothetical protein
MYAKSVMGNREARLRPRIGSSESIVGLHRFGQFLRPVRLELAFVVGPGASHTPRY